MKKIYLSGKMTGLETKDIIKTFAKYEKQLIDEGHAVLNPAVMWNLQAPERFTPAGYLTIDFAMMDNCNTIAVIPGYEDSKGVQAELDYAKELKMEIIYLK